MANAAKYARRLKHIRKVKAAIRFQEQARERLMAIKKKKHESKQYLLQADDNFVHEPRRKLKDTLKRAEQDWKLGPLRQNFAVGVDAKLWGVAARKDMQKPTLPEHWFGSADREEKAIAKGVQKLIPEHVRRDYSPIAVDDRVVVLRGRDAGKIGVVRSVYKNTNSLLVENLNKGWADGSLLGSEAPRDKNEMEMPLAIDDVRLVVPQVFTETHGDRTYKVHQDVIVEAVDVERHTSGADPFTGEDTAQVPKEHQVDPFTGKPILHRYIAGTRIPIPWPWETEQQNKDDSEVIDQDKLDEEDKARGIRGILRKPLAWWGRGAKKPEQSSSKASSERKDAADYDPEIINRGEPSEREPRDFDDDTTRNLVEMREIAPNLYDDPNAFHPSLVYPPIPETIIEEIQGHSKFRRTAELSAEEKEAYRARRRAEREAKARRQEEKKQKATATMKTPMQVRWELQQAKKQNAPPTIPSEDLLLAIGKHMAAKGRTLEKEAA